MQPNIPLIAEYENMKEKYDNNDNDNDGQRTKFVELSYYI